MYVSTWMIYTDALAVAQVASLKKELTEVLTAASTASAAHQVGNSGHCLGSLWLK